MDGLVRFVGERDLDAGLDVKAVVSRNGRGTLRFNREIPTSTTDATCLGTTADPRWGRRALRLFRPRTCFRLHP